MKCPCCFTVLPVAPTHFQCAGSCARAVNERASLARGHEVLTPPITGPFPNTPGARIACAHCNLPTTVESCPTCAYPIPRNWRQSQVTCVAIAGARATGKSCMIAVAVRQLEVLAERHHRSILRGLEDTPTRFEAGYVEPLFRQAKALQSTRGLEAADPITRDPLMFHYTERIPGHPERSRILVLRDIAGEDFENRVESTGGLGFFARADAVLVLIDPLTVPQIRHMLADLIPEPDRLGGDGLRVLSHVLSLMTGGVPAARTDIPVGLVLSKFDSLQRLRDVRGNRWSSVMSRPGSPMQRDASLTSRSFDTVDGDLMHFEVSGLLEMLDAQAIPAILSETANHYRFFGASALGESTEGEDLDPGGIAPFRTLDPFKWALSLQG
jgi:hypothetical protein